MGDGARYVAANVRNLKPCGLEGGLSSLRAWIIMVVTVGHIRDEMGSTEMRPGAGTFPAERTAAALEHRQGREETKK